MPDVMHSGLVKQTHVQLERQARLAAKPECPNNAAFGWIML
jgi:hypothetical protein